MKAVLKKNNNTHFNMYTTDYNTNTVSKRYTWFLYFLEVCNWKYVSILTGLRYNRLFWIPVYSKFLWFVEDRFLQYICVLRKNN